MITITFKIIVVVCVCIFISLPTHTFSSNEVNLEIVSKQEMIPYATYNSCGGYIEAKLDQNIILEYKPDEEYDNDELCVWEIRNDECYGALLTKTKSGFEVGHDFLQITGFNSFVGEGPHFTEKMGNTTGLEQVSGAAYVTFVIFSTDYSNKGTGFRLGIVGYGDRIYRRWQDDFFTFSPVGTTTLRPYFHDMTTTFVIAPEYKSVASIALDIEYLTESLDYLMVYRLELNGGEYRFRLQGDKIQGNGTVSLEAVYYTYFIVFFYSDNSVIPQGGGVALNWYIPDNATAETLA